MSIASEGFPFVLVPFAAGMTLLVLSPGVPFSVAGVIFLIAALFCLFFFRDPEIKITEGENLVLSPCNGTVMQIDKNETETVVRVFLSIFNVHLQRSPAAGTVKSTEHKPGKFLMAMRKEAHLVNEQNILIMESTVGGVPYQFTLKQIAGFLARRCVLRIKAGDTLRAGDKIGLIKFSSQVDLHIPGGIEIKVKKGDKVVSGVTVFGEIPAGS